MCFRDKLFHVNRYQAEFPRPPYSTAANPRVYSAIFHTLGLNPWNLWVSRSPRGFSPSLFLHPVPFLNVTHTRRSQVYNSRTRVHRCFLRRSTTLLRGYRISLSVDRWYFQMRKYKWEFQEEPTAIQYLMRKLFTWFVLYMLEFNLKVKINNLWKTRCVCWNNIRWYLLNRITEPNVFKI